MTELDTDVPDFEAPGRSEETLILELDGFEGPLDLLLALARHQKVDILKISVLQLADQYLAFIEQAGRHKLELAADYLVMAAWLTYFKSRLVFQFIHNVMYFDRFLNLNPTNFDPGFSVNADCTWTTHASPAK